MAHLVVIENYADASHTMQQQGLIGQYRELLQRTSPAGPADIVAEDMCMSIFKEGQSLCVLVDDEGTVVAGATITLRHNQGIHENWEFLEKKQPLPLPTYDFQEYVFGHISDTVSDATTSGAELQKQLMQALKDGTLGVDVLKGYVPYAKAFSLHEAAKELGIKMVARQDLTRATPAGSAFFVAATANSDIELVPEGSEKDVVPEDTLRVFASSEIANPEIHRVSQEGREPAQNFMKPPIKPYRERGTGEPEERQ